MYEGKTVSEFLKENKKRSYLEFTVCNEDMIAIVDDRIGYLDARSSDYNKSWKAKCRGKKIVREFRTHNGIGLVIA